MNPLDISWHISWELKELKVWEKHTVQGNEILSVVSWEMYNELKGRLKTFESSAYYSWDIEAQEDTLLSVFTMSDASILLDKIDVEEVFWEFCRANWSRLCELLWCEALTETDLYRWDQVEKEYKWIKYRFNLWFCWADTDCLWHNQHDFIETHTNLAGAGYMQKSSDGTDDGLEETYGLLPGNSHRTFNIDWQTEDNGNPKYPMHRWLGGNTGNIWFVIEKY